MASKRRSPGDGSLTKRKSDGLWVGSVEIPSLDGKRRQRRVFSKNRNEAIRKLAALRAEVEAIRIAEAPAPLLDAIRVIVREELAAHADGPSATASDTAPPSETL